MWTGLKRTKLDSKGFFLVLLALLGFIFFTSLKGQSASLLLTQACVCVSRLPKLLDSVEE